MRILGINAVFHDPAAALVVDGEIVAAAEEERFSRRKHGKQAVPFSTWEQPAQAAAWCLAQAGLSAKDLDAVGYSYDPELVEPGLPGHDPSGEELRTQFAQRAPMFLKAALPGLDPGIVRFVRHHVAHAASAALAAPFGDCAVLVADGRGESTSHLAGEYRDGRFKELAAQRLPHSLGLLYEDLTEHLGFARSSDEYKVMALASYGTPEYLDQLCEHVHVTGDGGFHTAGVDLAALAPRREAGEELTRRHADLAASVQKVLEDVLLGARVLAARAHRPARPGAGRRDRAQLRRQQPAARRRPVRTALGTTRRGRRGHGARRGAAAGRGRRGARCADGERGLGREWSDAELEDVLRKAKLPYERPGDLAETVAEALADDEVVAWFQGRAEFGPRALGPPLAAGPSRAATANLERLNDVKGREQFRPVAPMVRAERASEIFSRGPLPSPYMLFVHDVAPEWRDRIPAVTHVDGTARVQTVDDRESPLLARMLAGFERRTGLPVVINTSLNTAGRPMVDSPRDALECFGSAPIDLLALGPFVLRRPIRTGGASPEEKEVP